MISAQHLKEEARRLGFQHCGMAPAEPVGEDFVRRYTAWLEAGKQEEMHYLEQHLDKRFDPRLLVPGTRTVVSLAMNYRPDPLRTVPGIAWYAQGQDYHDILRERMQQLMQRLDLHGRCFVDTAPVPERYWAWRCGLGWLGRHGQMVVPGEGSTFFLGELFVEEEADSYDQTLASHCSGCNCCMEACPSPDSCLNYWLIEYRGASLPQWVVERLRKDGQPLFYGCDRCQRPCPHQRVEPTTEAAFRPNEALMAMTPDDWLNLTVEQYRELFRGSAVKRAKYDGLMRNIRAVLGKADDEATS